MIKLASTYCISLIWLLAEMGTHTLRKSSKKTVLKIDLSSRPIGRRMLRYFEPPHSTLRVFSLDSTKDTPSKHSPVMWRPNRVIPGKTDPKWSVRPLLRVCVCVLRFYLSLLFNLLLRPIPSIGGRTKSIKPCGSFSLPHERYKKLRRFR